MDAVAAPSARLPAFLKKSLLESIISVLCALWWLVLAGQKPRGGVFGAEVGDGAVEEGFEELGRC